MKHLRDTIYETYKHREDNNISKIFISNFIFTDAVFVEAWRAAVAWYTASWAGLVAKQTAVNKPSVSHRHHDKILRGRSIRTRQVLEHHHW